MRAPVALALASLAIVLVALLALHVARPDLDPRVRFMSEYSFGGTRVGMAVVFIGMGSASAGIAAAWWRDGARLAGSLLAAWGAGIAALAIFIGGPGGTLDQVVHDGVRDAAMLALIAAGLLALREDVRARRGAWVALGLALGALALVPHALANWARVWDAPGLAQRAAGAAAWLWLVAMAWRARGDGRRGR